MEIFHNIEEWINIRRNLPAHLSIGFVPTMGNLHQGHASLFTASQRENDITVVSLFINPKQFNKEDDFLLYPRTLDADLNLLQQHGVDYCIIPHEQVMYADDYRYQIHENKRSLIMEGKHRPGHFTGMLTVVMKLLQLVKPHRSYFGEKDYQQWQLIRDMATSFFMGIQINVCPTIRDQSGLALSSRNNRLNPAQRHLADQFAHIFHQSEKTCTQIESELTTLGIRVDYIEDHDQRRFAAIYIDDIRLIDNYALPSLLTS